MLRSSDDAASITSSSINLRGRSCVTSAGFLQRRTTFEEFWEEDEATWRTACYTIPLAVSRSLTLQSPRESACLTCTKNGGDGWQALLQPGGAISGLRACVVWKHHHQPMALHGDMHNSPETISTSVSILRTSLVSCRWCPPCGRGVEVMGKAVSAKCGRIVCLYSLWIVLLLSASRPFCRPLSIALFLLSLLSRAVCAVQSYESPLFAA